MSRYAKINKSSKKGRQCIVFFSRWTLFQGIIITSLVALGFVADLFKTKIAVPFSSSGGISTQRIMTFLFIVVVVGLLSLLMYFQTKKSATFLKHRLWSKMHILMPLFFIISMLVIFSILLIDPLNEIVQNNRWLIYILIYYVLYVVNVMVLAFVHQAKKRTISNPSKIKYSFMWTSLVLFVILFMM